VTHDPRAAADVQREQQLQTARWCGYPGTDAEAVLSLNREHDPLHCLLAGLFDKGSPVMRWVASGYADYARAHPTRHDDVIGWHEDLALETARWLNTGEFGGTMRVLWAWGVEPGPLRHALLIRLGREA
jgi:hypothetical protein